MATKKQILKVLWIIIGIIVVAAIACLIIFPGIKGMFLAGSGGFLILNIFISMFFIQNNYRDKNK